MGPSSPCYSQSVTTSSVVISVVPAAIFFSLYHEDPKIDKSSPASSWGLRYLNPYNTLIFTRILLCLKLIFFFSYQNFTRGKTLLLHLKVANTVYSMLVPLQSTWFDTPAGNCDVTHRHWQCFHGGVDISFSGSRLLASVKLGEAITKKKKLHSWFSICWQQKTSSRSNLSKSQSLLRLCASNRNHLKVI